MVQERLEALEQECADLKKRLKIEEDTRAGIVAMRDEKVARNVVLMSQNAELKKDAQGANAMMSAFKKQVDTLIAQRDEQAVEIKEVEAENLQLVRQLNQAKDILLAE